MSNFSSYEPPKITYLAPLIKERKEKTCQCKNRHIVVDVTNRTVECSVCGQFINPFDALVEIAGKNEKYDNYLEAQYSYACELNKWFKHHQEPIVLKRIISEYRQGLIPKCPKCGEYFDLTEIKSFTSKEFYTKLKLKNEEQEK